MDKVFVFKTGAKGPDEVSLGATLAGWQWLFQAIKQFCEDQPTQSEESFVVIPLRGCWVSGDPVAELESFSPRLEPPNPRVEGGVLGFETLEASASPVAPRSEVKVEETNG